ncbi:MAG: hypothetical protein NXI32_27495 [bacterium]|nr:hypothetical protein [bacterium]
MHESNTCSAYPKSSSGRGDETEKTKRHQIAERLAANTDHLLLLTAAPYHGDDDRFSHFIRLIVGDLFPEPSRVGNRANEIRQDILYNVGGRSLEGIMNERFWELQNRGEIVTIREGRAVRVPHSALVEYLERKLISK